MQVVQWLVAITGGVKLVPSSKSAYVMDLYLLPSLLINSIVKNISLAFYPKGDANQPLNDKA